ncbi:TatD family hydrolase [Chryseosolibacter indicus]|uniref:TatD family hydrolase n=1 Tax=Chryseosolibacter indicus TaxID=2782351 RepID=A0ABS5VVQ0_9BACT|nr:TatD family hydrolase [Chryseosolibacter indicus]MBT1705505.1 TatD family hydrolase [Chryseosolibacter indicus]
MSYWIDTHAHIYSDEFNDDRARAIRKAEEHNVKRIYMPNVDHASIDAILEAELRYPDFCIPMMGLHPCSVKKDFERELYIVEDWLAKRKFCAVGEIGTDLYWDKSFWEQQKEAFTIQVNWAKKYKLPIIIHCRESIDQTIELVEGLQDGNLTGIFHCFTGSVEQAKKIIKLNFYLGIGGVATFKNGGLDKVLPEIALDHLVMETDSPYLAPVPFRGKRNEPSYIPAIAQKISEYKKVSTDEIAEKTTNNALKLFDQKH